MAGQLSSATRLIAGVGLIIALAILLAMMATMRNSASAADFTVTRFDDPAPDGCAAGDCSLREAIIDANAAPGTDSITLGAGVHTLSIVGTAEDASVDGDLDITDDLTITGAGAGSTTIDGNGGVTDERVLHVDPLASGITVEISGVSVVNGVEGLGAGGIWNSGSLALHDVTVRDNAAIGAGGIFNDGTMAITNSTISDNSAGFDSGGIRNDGVLSLIGSEVSGNAANDEGGGIRNSGTLDITNSTVSSNTASTAGGGGLYSEAGTVTISDSAIDANTAGSDGGGIRNSSTLTVANSTVSNNGAVANGGGIYHTGGGRTLTVANSTVSGNTAGAWGGGIMNSEGSTALLTNVTVSGNTADRGGGIGNSASELEATLQLNSSTVSDNTAGSEGGGIFNSDLGVVGLKNTIVANSLSGHDCAGNSAITSDGNNLDSDGSCGLGAAGDLPNTDPQLGPLASNGGPTRTMALLATNPAIDAGSEDCPPPDTDQRGIARPVDGDEDGTATCDIGAYEFEPVPSTPTRTTTSAAPGPTATVGVVVAPSTGSGGESGDNLSTWLIAPLTAAAVAAAGAYVALRLRRG